ncbi:ATP-binding protein [Actinomadura barringtoniae]|uniref:ATP-binding protein n=1 Tax=Actinomadura barringtoniae TaxID=1427535 RepID=UPI0027DD6E1E|nr:LuxR C-terminal-related transcriptional regulator [Actinomadura barringtoniae]
MERRAGTTLPAEMTRFIGRQRELADIEAAFGRSRLVTLCGLGGVGKSRLALRAASALRDRYADGACFVELSALRRPELLARTVAEALRIPDQEAGDPVDVLADRMADCELLLVLDTCEHLVDACALLAEVLLRAAPRLRILATSRESLDVMGEHVFRVAPLETEGEDCDSVALFTDRAVAMAPGFELSDANRAAVARLCRRLDGLPLAIELAAVRLRVMSVEQIDERLGDRFRLLGTARSGRDRHRTLRATVEWSHDLCDEGERLLWARLSVFPGTFDLTAAERVCADDELPAYDLLDVLGRLVEKSIVLCDPGRGRYRMLDTIRDFGAERLDTLDERACELRRRHAVHYRELAEQTMRTAAGDRQIPLLRALNDEHDNLRVALEELLSSPATAPEGMALLVSLFQYWLVLGLFGEARHWYAKSLAANGRPSADRLWNLGAACMFAVLQGDLDPARPLLDEGSALVETLDDPLLPGLLAMCTGWMRLQEENLDEAQKLMEQARSVFDEVGYLHPITIANYHLLGAVHCFKGEPQLAMPLCERALEISREQGDLWNVSFAIFVRAAAHWLLGEADQAVPDAIESLGIKEEFGDLYGIALCVDLLAACAVSDGDFERAAMLSGNAEVMWHAIGAPTQLGPSYLAIRVAAETVAEQALPADTFAAAKARGARLTTDETLALARGMDGPELAQEAAPEAPAPDVGPLTRRELEVAGLVAEGLTNREIADRLVIAKRTADSHVEHILAKLGFASRAQVAVWAERRSRD